jgi:hypothetical protein
MLLTVPVLAATITAIVASPATPRLITKVEARPGSKTKPKQTAQHTTM